jgi:hypothetical protein
MFQWQTIGKKNWAALPPKKCAFQTPQPNRRDLERKQVVLEQVPFIR